MITIKEFNILNNKDIIDQNNPILQLKPEDRTVNQQAEILSGYCVENKKFVEEFYNLCNAKTDENDSKNNDNFKLKIVGKCLAFFAEKTDVVAKALTLIEPIIQTNSSKETLLNSVLMWSGMDGASKLYSSLKSQWNI